MYANQLLDLVEKDPPIKRVFGGIYAYDQLPNIKKTKSDTAIIINSSPSTSPGTHWLLAYIKPKLKTIIWFDSFGHKPEYYGRRLAKWTEGYKLYSSRKVIQAENSHYCGLFVLYFLYYLSRGVKIEKILQKFSRHLHSNDCIVSRFAWNKFRFNARKEIVSDNYIRKMNVDFFCNNG